MSGALQGSVVLVTGGAGLVGSHIVDLLIAERVREVRVLDNLSRGLMENLPITRQELPIVFVQGDVRDREKVADLVSGCDYVFHQAGIGSTLCDECPRECVDVLVGGTINVFESAVEAGVKKVVYASSAFGHGGFDSLPTDGCLQPFKGPTMYGAAKLMNEGIASHCHEKHGLPSVGLRYSNVYGPRMDLTWTERDSVAPGRASGDREERPRDQVAGSDWIDLVFVEDVARANLLAMKSDRVNDVYNVSGGREISLTDLRERIAMLPGVSDLTIDFSQTCEANPVTCRPADTRRAWEEIGFVAAVTLEEGLRRLAGWRRDVFSRFELLAS